MQINLFSRRPTTLKKLYGTNILCVLQKVYYLCVIAAVLRFLDSGLYSMKNLPNQSLENMHCSLMLKVHFLFALKRCRR